MSVSVILYPNREIEVSTNISKWSALHHPIKFGMQRRDYECYMYNSAGELVVVFAGADQVVTIGDTIYFKADNGSFGTATVISESTNDFNATITTGSISAGYGFINLDTRLNYYVKTKIWGVDGTNNYYLIGTSINKPLSNGILSVDVSAFLKSLVGYTNAFDYSIINWKDSTLGGRYNITYAEFWTDYSGNFSGISNTLLYYFSNSAKQLQDVYGSNMGEFVPFPTSTTKAKFLSDFNSPTYFVGYPFSLSFIYSDAIAEVEITRHEQPRDINNNTVGGEDTDVLTPDHALGVNRLMIGESYGATVKMVDVWLEAGAAAVLTLFEATAFEDELFSDSSPLTTVGIAETV